MATEKNNDIDPIETQEWLDALQAVVTHDGDERAAFLIQELLNKVNAEGIKFAGSVNTPYKNTIKTIHRLVDLD